MIKHPTHWIVYVGGPVGGSAPYKDPHGNRVIIKSDDEEFAQEKAEAIVIQSGQYKPGALQMGMKVHVRKAVMG